jgi:hypothetical protein
MESSNFCTHTVKTKISSKICVHSMKTPTICHNYLIYHKNKIYMHATARLHMSSGWARFLCHLYKLFMIFTQKNKTIIYGVHPIWGLGCWTIDLTDARGGVGPGAHRRGVWVLGHRGGRPGLPLPFVSPRLSIYISYIYIDPTIYHLSHSLARVPTTPRPTDTLMPMSS